MLSKPSNRWEESEDLPNLIAPDLRSYGSCALSPLLANLLSSSVKNIPCIAGMSRMMIWNREKARRNPRKTLRSKQPASSSIPNDTGREYPGRALANQALTRNKGSNCRNPNILGTSPKDSSQSMWLQSRCCHLLGVHCIQLLYFFGWRSPCVKTILWPFEGSINHSS